MKMKKGACASLVWIPEQGNFSTCIHPKQNSIGVYYHFDNYLPSEDNVYVIHNLEYESFCLCSDWTKLHIDQNIFSKK